MTRRAEPRTRTANQNQNDQNQNDQNQNAERRTPNAER